VLHLIPMFRPEIVAGSSVPSVFHADFSRVTAENPARGGELLILMATGLGPTRPGVDPGNPFPAFPASPLVQVNSPLQVSVNGQVAEVLNKVGWPGLVDTYRVDFRVPEGTAAGPAAIQITAAWIAGPAALVPMR
jgi:uncharacterized protein (TIGR03437 family)